MRRLLVPLLIVLALAACGTRAAPPESDDGHTASDHVTTTASPTVDGVQPLPEGWRWESYGGVQVGVPDDWATGNPFGRLYQWCLNDADALATPMVGRPGPITAVGCGTEDETEANPETLLAYTGTVVALGAAERPDGTTREGDRTTVRLGGVEVIVQAEPELREAIAATIHTVDAVDHALCPVSHPISGDPAYRPTTPPPDAGEVTAISACRYALQTHLPETPAGPAPLISSLRLTGDTAQTAAAGITDSPVGGGPNSPGTCAVDWSYGEEVIVLLVSSTSGETEIVLRYAGCDHHGFDDGSTVRTLTAHAVAPFIQAPNLVTEASSGMSEILFPEPATGTTDESEHTSAPTASREAVPFELYTHCGIHETYFDGGWYQRVDGVLDDGNGNPPPGWTNPSQAGAMARVDEETIVFTDDVGHQEYFRLREGATAPLHVCS